MNSPFSEVNVIKMQLSAVKRLFITRLEFLTTKYADRSLDKKVFQGVEKAKKTRLPLQCVSWIVQQCNIYRTIIHMLSRYRISSLIVVDIYLKKLYRTKRRGFLKLIWILNNTVGRFYSHSIIFFTINFICVINADEIRF